jgi:hypothetical protein
MSGWSTRAEGEAGVVAVDEPESAVRCPGLVERRDDEVGGARGEPRVPRMRLHDDGAPDREGGSGVAAGDREREREVGCREHRDGAERAQHASQVGTRGRRVRCRVVDRRFEVGALLDDIREQPELPGRARDLAAQACLPEPGLVVGDRHELVGVRV